MCVCVFTGESIHDRLVEKIWFFYMDGLRKNILAFKNIIFSVLYADYFLSHIQIGFFNMELTQELLWYRRAKCGPLIDLVVKSK